MGINLRNNYAFIRIIKYLKIRLFFLKRFNTYGTTMVGLGRIMTNVLYFLTITQHTKITNTSWVARQWPRLPLRARGGGYTRSGWSTSNLHSYGDTIVWIQWRYKLSTIRLYSPQFMVAQLNWHTNNLTERCKGKKGWAHHYIAAINFWNRRFNKVLGNSHPNRVWQ